MPASKKNASTSDTPEPTSIIEPKASSSEKTVDESPRSLFSQHSVDSNTSEGASAGTTIFKDSRKVKKIECLVLTDSTGHAIGLGFTGAYDIKDLICNSLKRPQKVCYI